MVHKPHALFYKLGILTECQRALINEGLYTVEEKADLQVALDALDRVIESLKQRGIYTGMTEPIEPMKLKDVKVRISYDATS